LSSRLNKHPVGVLKKLLYSISELQNHIFCPFKSLKPYTNSTPSKMKRLLFLSVFNITLQLLFSQLPNALRSQEVLNINDEAASKILSGKLIEKTSQLLTESAVRQKKGTDLTITVVLYFTDYPSPGQIRILENLQVKLYYETWTPAMENHELGFLVASVSADKLREVLDLPFIKKVDTAERSSAAMNNTATQSINAPLVWVQGYTGSGVKIGILDSGIDLGYAGEDLPGSFPYKDYSYFPTLDDNVANTVTGHGTHVTATALGRGLLSEGQTHVNNGKGAFKGSAPAADLVFLKIGQDEDGWAEDASLIAAIDAAINEYHVDILSLSYGGWTDHHDGSSAIEQKVDWAYEQGVPFFCSAGNAGNDNKHFMDTLSAHTQSDFIELQVKGAGDNDTRLRFNLVWSDGSNRNNLTLQYYNPAKELINDVTLISTTESLRGTESQYSYCNNYLPAGDGTYYLKVINNSDNAQVFHIFEDWSNLREGTSFVSFAASNADYTIGAPASADHAFAVGAYVSRTLWTDYADNSWWYGATYVFSNIAPFSSLGPTLDGRIKPDICAPGHVLISLRDKDVYTTPNKGWIDNDGVTGGEVNYYRMNGTSMACPVVSGAAALYLEKYPGAAPQQIYDAIKNFSNISGLKSLPNNTWGYGKLDIFNAIRGKRDDIVVDGNMDDEKYETLAVKTNDRNGFGADNTLGALKYYSDGQNLFFGITGELTGNDNIALFLDFSGYQGRGTNTLGGGNSGDFVQSAFSYIGNVKMDFDVDFALAFNKGYSTTHEFFTDAIRYGNSNICSNIGKTNQMGASFNYDISSVFGGTGYITVAYDTGYVLDHNKGIEMKIPVSAFAGIDTSQTIRFFAMITSMEGDVSNECVPGDPGDNNLGNGADFSAISGQDFFTQSVKMSKAVPTGIDPPKNHLPQVFSLFQNYPNPFSASTTLRYNLPYQSPVIIKIFDFTGKEITTLVNSVKPAGEHQVIWYAGDLPEGVYLCRFQSGNFSETKKMILKK
jgi:minor extracellular serine protease Vpr